MKPNTRALHTRVDTGDQARPVVTPIYQSSAYEAGSEYFYMRKANPNALELEQCLATLEGAEHCLALTTGMTALRQSLDLLAPGERIVVNQDTYGCTFRLIDRVAARVGLKISQIDLSVPEALEEIPTDVRMVLFESPTNPFLKTVPIAKVAARVKELNPEALILVDNTWATPLFQRPLEHGADLVVYSATKYFSGHSDVMGGFILTDRSELAAELRDNRFYSGAILAPHSAWLIRRSLQTLGLRMREHQRVTDQMRVFLEEQPQVDRVYSPIVDGVQLTGYGGILFFDLREDLVEHYTAFSESLELFDTGTGMACVTSMVAQPYTGSHASMSCEEKAAIGLDRGLVRLCFGLEDVDDLQADLKAAFAKIDVRQSVEIRESY